MSGIVTYKKLGLNGRTGNCLFQIAATIGYGISHNKFYTFPKWEHAHFFKNFPDNLTDVSTLNQINEAGFAYQPLPFKDGDVNLEGYFQSEKYFEHCKKLVLAQLELDYKHQNTVNELYSKINPNNLETVAIHVRRGDYVTNPGTNEYHGVLPLSYYEHAIEVASSSRKLLNQPLFVVFSDDIDWCKENIKSELLNIHFMEQNGSVIDLFLMSKCDHQIIANSSYSWWSAYINSNPDKIVIAPEYWFKGGPKNTDDLIPKNWIRI
ncbi:MAG TPA: alpha-1,2-fucosyltransferase [Bacteroidia bacterium]|nr:alpha-1,2-fucosyltransferase [Bacteroidia bacterium]